MGAEMSAPNAIDAAILPGDVTDAQAHNYAAFTGTLIADEAILNGLANLPPVEYDRVRKDQAKKMGVRQSTLDGLVEAARPRSAPDEKNSPFSEVEPWPETIDPAQLLNEVSAAIRRFVILSKCQSDAATLWVAACWLVDVIECAPIALINAPEKACGKTQFLNVLAKLAPRPAQASGISPSVLFRMIEKYRPTLFVDEIETVLTKENEALRGLINAGHTRDSAYVWRSVAVGDDFEPRRFSVWGMKAIAGINADRLAETVTSRSVIFDMRRKLRNEKTSRMRDAEPGLFDTLTAKFARFAADYSGQVKQARPVLPDALSDRQQDNFEPLLAIASCAGPEWLDRATVAALMLSNAGGKITSTGNELLNDIRDVFESKRVDRISTADLIMALVADDEKTWATYNRGRPISPKQIATRLSGYEITSKQMRLSPYDNPVRGFEISQFTDVFARYLPENAIFPVTQLQASNHGLSHVSDCENATPAQTQSVTRKPAPNQAGNGVTDKTSIFGGTADETHLKTNHLRI